MKPVKKVVLVSTPRTGSTLICEMLAQHPAILGFGEIFLHNEDGRRWYHKVGTSGDRRYYPGPDKFEEYLAYLEAIARLEDKSHLLFKLMDYQEEKAWQMIESDQTIPVIHARRFNALEAVASVLASEKSGAWHGHTAEDIKKVEGVSVQVTLEQIEEWHARNQALEDRFHRLRNPKIAIAYTVLRRDPAWVAEHAFRFLELPPFPVKITQKKLNTRKLSDRISNYHDLKAAACKTPLDCFFYE